MKAIVVTGSNNKFSAGFDIAEFAKSSGGGGIDSRHAHHPLLYCQHEHSCSAVRACNRVTCQ